MIGNLNKSRSARIDEKWGVGNVADNAPLGTDFTKLAAKLLERGFACGFVENNHPPLGVARSLLSPQEEVEAFTKVLERRFYDVAALV